MAWLMSFLSALLCGVAGLVLAGFIANACVVWYHVSSFEGASGYFVIFMALLGGVLGFVIGLIANRIVIGQGGQTSAAFAIPLGVVLAVAALVTGFAWIGGDVPPELHGERINLMVEIRTPEGWTPKNRIRAGQNRAVLASVNVSGTEGYSTSGAIEWSAARVDGRAWIIPSETSVFTTSGKRRVTITLGGDDVASFFVPLPGRPGTEYESWSDWLPATDDSSATSAFHYRFRVRPGDEAFSERTAAAEARATASRLAFESLDEDSPLESWVEFLEPDVESDYQTRAGQVITQRPDELVALIASPDLAISSSAVRGLSWFNAPPDGAESALRVMLGNLVVSVRAWHAALDPDDPDLLGAVELKDRYLRWRTGFEKVVAAHQAPSPPELEELRDEIGLILAEPGMRGTTEIDALESLVTQNLEEWQSE